MNLSGNQTLIGIDLGGTKVASGIVDKTGLKDIKHQLIPAQSKDPMDVTNSIIEVVEELFDNTVLGIGIGVPGLVDREKGVAFDIQNIPSWKEVHLKDILEDKFKVPVFLDNDANCFALGEAKFGDGKDEKDFVGLTLGTGMGAGIIKDGYLMPDAHCGSGEFGNIPYLDSIYEDYCSGKFFKEHYGENGEVMVEKAKEGDETAMNAFAEFGKHLGKAIKTIMLAVDPRKIIIGGSVAQSKDYFEKSMWETIKDFPFPGALNDFDVVFSDVKNIAVLGAASLYLDRNKV
ncbi:MAG: ROK family protein [Chlorobi bacterium]|nr:ROK family protein [Chlorobiota bacterium]